MLGFAVWTIEELIHSGGRGWVCQMTKFFMFQGNAVDSG